MTTFEFFSAQLNEILATSSIAQLFFQSPEYIGSRDFGPITMSMGATRICLISNKWDSVVKINWDEDCGGNACERECSYYENAVDSNLDQYFAKPTYIGTYKWYGRGYKAHDVYDYVSVDLESETDDELEEDLKCGGISLQKVPLLISFDLYEYPKADESGIYYYTPTNEVRETVEKFRNVSPLAARNKNVAAMFITEYGFEEFQRLSDFLNWWEINDLHGDNIGYVDGNLVLIDYAGYREEY